MKNRILSIGLCLSIVTSSIFLSGCFKQTCKQTETVTLYRPVYQEMETVKGNIKSNPAKPIEHPGKLFILGKYIFLNEIDKGIHVIDNTDPMHPENAAFIDIPGNLDLAVKGSVLYADLYADLVTIDISDPLSVKVLNYNTGVFPHRNYGLGFVYDSLRIISSWVAVDTVLTSTCDPVQPYLDYYFNASSGGTRSFAASPVGKGGSMARFAITGNYLYTVSYSGLNVFNITNGEKPEFSNKVNLDLATVETIFPLSDNLFIGGWNGMNIYNISDPLNPSLTGQFGDVQSCDPVIADEDYAYVTLRGGTMCNSFTNQLDILQLNHLTDPVLMQSYGMTNPHGLSKDGDLLFICDGEAGLKVFDAGDVMDLKPVAEFEGMKTHDVIAFNKIALVVAEDGLYQFDYSNENAIHLISVLKIQK